MQPEKFSKIGYLDRYENPKRNFCLRLLGDFVPVLKVNLEYLKDKNFHFSSLIPVLNPKSNTFSPLVPIQSPLEIEDKNSKKVFWVVPVQIPYFWT
jgi:hypothetical protein